MNNLSLKSKGISLYLYRKKRRITVKKISKTPEEKSADMILIGRKVTHFKEPVLQSIEISSKSPVAL